MAFGIKLSKRVQKVSNGIGDARAASKGIGEYSKRVGGRIGGRATKSKFKSLLK